MVEFQTKLAMLRSKSIVAKSTYQLNPTFQTKVIYNLIQKQYKRVFKRRKKCQLYQHFVDLEHVQKYNCKKFWNKINKSSSSHN